MTKAKTAPAAAAPEADKKKKKSPEKKVSGGVKKATPEVSKKKSKLAKVTAAEEDGLDIAAIIKGKTKAELKKYKEPRAPPYYSIFFKEESLKVRDANPELNFTEVSREVAELWKNIPESQKDKYREQANRKHQEAYEAWKQIPEKEREGVLAVLAASSKKNNKSSVKRSPTEYALFLKEMWTSVFEKNPDFTFVEISQTIAKLWHELTPDEKQKYTDIRKSLEKESKDNEEEEKPAAAAPAAVETPVAEPTTAPKKRGRKPKKDSTVTAMEVDTAPAAAPEPEPVVAPEPAAAPAKKRNVTPYKVYCDENREALAERNKGLSSAQITKLLHQNYANLTPSTRKPYEAKAASINSK